MEPDPMGETWGDGPLPGDPLADIDGNQANYQAQQHGQTTTFLAPNLFNVPTPMHDATTARHRQDTFQTNAIPANGHLMAKPDNNIWYCQYVNVPNSESFNLNHARQPSPETFQVPSEYDHKGRTMQNNNRCSSSSPQRLVSLSNGGSNCKKPCAVIAPHLVQNQPEKKSNHQHVQNVQSVRSLGTTIIRNSSPVPSIKLDNEFGLSSSAPAHNQCWTYQTPTAEMPQEFSATKQKLIERSQGTNNSGSCPDINYTLDTSHIGPNKRSIGTSCSDLDKPVPFVVETCQICNLFHPKAGSSTAEEASMGQPYYSYSPCLYGNKVVLNAGTSQMPEGEHSTSPKEFFPENTNKLDNRPDKSVVVKYDRNCKVQPLRQETKDGKTEQIKRYVATSHLLFSSKPLEEYYLKI